MKHLSPTIAMFVPQIATQIYLQVNKTMLGAFTGVQASGFYDNSDKIVKILLAVVTATGTVLLPHSAHSFASGRHDQVEKSLTRSMHFILVLACPMAAGLAGVAPVFTKGFFGADFWPVSSLLMIESVIIILVGISNATGVQYLLPTNQLVPFTTSVILGAIGNIILNIPLILLYGGNGAMVATVLSEFLVTGYQVYKIKGQLSLNGLFRETWKYLVAAVIMGCSVRIFVYTLSLSNVVGLLGAAMYGILVYSIGLLLLKPHVLIKMIVDFRNR